MERLTNISCAECGDSIVCRNTGHLNECPDDSHKFCSLNCHMTNKNKRWWQNPQYRTKIIEIVRIGGHKNKDNHNIGKDGKGWFRRQEIIRYNNTIRIYRNIFTGRFISGRFLK